jgi:hypothetical protein
MLLRQPDVRRLPAEGGRAGKVERALVPLLMLVTGACAGAPQSAFQQLPSEQAVIRLAHPAFDPASSVDSVARDPQTGATWHVSEVNGDRALGAIVTSKMPPGQEAVRRPIEESVRSIIPSRFRIAWGPIDEAAGPSGPLSYRLFSMGEAEDGPTLACVAFSQRDGPASADGQSRDVLYGYLCRYGRRPLERDVAESMLASISIERRT